MLPRSSRMPHPSFFLFITSSRFTFPAPAGEESRACGVSSYKHSSPRSEERSPYTSSFPEGNLERRVASSYTYMSSSSTWQIQTQLGSKGGGYTIVKPLRKLVYACTCLQPQGFCQSILCRSKLLWCNWENKQGFSELLAFIMEINS